MQKVLVTGADGFIGSHLTEMLLEQGHRVRALSYYNSFNYWGWLDGIQHPNLEVVTGDVRDLIFVNISQQTPILFSICGSDRYSLFVCSPG